MKKLVLLFGFFFFGFASFALAQPDSRDSVILESKIVLPGAGDPAFTMKVYITNKDSLRAFFLVLKKNRIEGEADVFIPYTCCADRFVNYLTNTLLDRRVCIPECYIGPFVNPDTLFMWGRWDYEQVSTLEPPNAVRKALWEIKFDSVYPPPGSVEYDSAQYFGFVTSFVNIQGQQIPVNFVKSVITVRPKGDFNLDGSLSGADVVELLNCVFDMPMPAGGAYPCDLNCDGRRSPADVIWELYAVFMGQAFPC